MPKLKKATVEFWYIVPDDETERRKQEKLAGKDLDMILDRACETMYEHSFPDHDEDHEYYDLDDNFVPEEIQKFFQGLNKWKEEMKGKGVDLDKIFKRTK